MVDQDEWSVHANKAIWISIVSPGETSPQTLSSFQPTFTYSIFGDKEVIAGYQGLRIELKLAAHDLRPHLTVHYDKKFKSAGGEEVADIEGSLREHLPGESFDKSSAYNEHIQNDPRAKQFKPPGELVDSYSSRGRNFEIWSGDLTDPQVKLLVSRLQVLVSFFIEGGTPLNLEEENWSLARWRLYFVYETVKPSRSVDSIYSFVGYASSYRFITPLNSATIINTTNQTKCTFSLPPSTPIHPSNLPSRIRISQFLILPSHHSHGHGGHLYDAMFQTTFDSPTCTEITVEDPSEAFDDLRDYRDYARLTKDGTFSQIKFNTSIDPKYVANKVGVRVPTSQLLETSFLESLRKQKKIAPRQWYRLVELYLFSKIPSYTRQAGTARLTQRGRSKNKDDRTFYYWRLLVKQRVYKQNKDTLIQFDRAERADKVEQSVGEIVGDYERLLRGMQKWKDAEEKVEKSGGVRAERSSPMKSRPKRKLLADDDAMDIGTPKRARSEAL